MASRSSIRIEFSLDRDIDAAANDVRDRVARVLDNLPDEAEPPEIAKVDDDTRAVMYLNVTSERLSGLEISDFTDRFLTDRFSIVPGVARVRKREMPDLKVFAVEPDASAILNGSDPGPHPIQGIGAGFVPEVLDRDLLDGALRVTGDDAKAYARRAAKEEGLLVGISSGASLAAVAQALPDLAPGARVLTYCYDTGERYLSVDGLFEMPEPRTLD